MYALFVNDIGCKNGFDLVFIIVPSPFNYKPTHVTLISRNFLRWLQQKMPPWCELVQLTWIITKAIWDRLYETPFRPNLYPIFGQISEKFWTYFGNISEKFWKNFGKISTQKTTHTKLIFEYYVKQSWILRYFKAIKGHYYKLKLGQSRILAETVS
jgi:hypothetical protein